jgi:hypothetical protein
MPAAGATVRNLQQRPVVCERQGTGNERGIFMKSKHLLPLGIGLLALSMTHVAMAETAAEAEANILVTGRTDLGLNLPSETGSRLGLTPLELPASIATIDGASHPRARGHDRGGSGVPRAGRHRHRQSWQR